MSEHLFNNKDIEQMAANGIALKETERQLAIFRTARPYLRLSGPCVPGSGIAVFDTKAQESLATLYEKEKKNRSFIKFVPASGAASRMFKILLGYLNRPGEIEQDKVARDAISGENSAKQLLIFMEGITKFAFFQDLRQTLSNTGSP